MGRSKSKILFAVAGGALAAAYGFTVRPWHLRWGATDAEVEKTLPGDEFVAQPKVNATHAITINAPVEKVWPWLVQIGQRRAGFYIMERRMMLGIKGRAEANLKPTNEGTLNAHHG